MQIVNKVVEKIGWGGIIIIFSFIAFWVRSLYLDNSQEANAKYTAGKITGIDSEPKGNQYIVYEFELEGHVFTGSVPISFCKECNSCCNINDSVVVKYDGSNPQNSSLVKGRE